MSPLAERSPVTPGVNPFVFVVGCPRSGTTLLQRMLDSHPQLAVANDSHIVTHGAPADGPLDPALTPELVERVRSYRRFHRLKLDDDDLATAVTAAQEAAPDGNARYHHLLAALFDRYAAKHDKPLAGEKTPDYGRYLPLLWALFPTVKVIHILRDGRDVALSVLEWANEGKGPGRLALWRQDPVATCALWWQWQVDTARRDGATNPRHYLEVRYEELVGNPEATLSRITAFLGLPFAAEMLAYHQGRTRHGRGLSAKSAWLPPTPGLRDWNEQMSTRDKAIFEAIAGDTLTRLGYPLGANPIPQGVMAEAERHRTWWATQAARRYRGRYGGSERKDAQQQPAPPTPNERPPEDPA